MGAEGGEGTAVLHLDELYVLLKQKPYILSAFKTSEPVTSLLI